MFDKEMDKKGRGTQQKLEAKIDGATVSNQVV